MTQLTVTGVYESKTTGLRATLRKVKDGACWYTIDAFRGWCNCSIETWEASMQPDPLFVLMTGGPVTSLEKWAVLCGDYK
jgi:hypothetical protein